MKFTILADERPSCPQCPFYQESFKPLAEESHYELIEMCMFTDIEDEDEAQASCPLTVVGTIFDTESGEEGT